MPTTLFRIERDSLPRIGSRFAHHNFAISPFSHKPKSALSHEMPLPRMNVVVGYTPVRWHTR